MEPDRVHGAIRVAIVSRDNLKNASPAKAFQRLDGRIFLAALRGVDRLANGALNSARESFQVSP